jgi:hypothetical protein
MRRRNKLLLTRVAGVAKPEGVLFLLVDSLGVQDSLPGHAVAFPIRLDNRPSVNGDQGPLPVGNALPKMEFVPNLAAPHILSDYGSVRQIKYLDAWLAIGCSGIPDRECG